MFIVIPYKYFIVTGVISSFEELRGSILRPIGFERMYLPLCKVADTPFLHRTLCIVLTAGSVQLFISKGTTR